MWGMNFGRQAGEFHVHLWATLGVIELDAIFHGGTVSGEAYLIKLHPQIEPRKGRTWEFLEIR